MTRIEDEVDHLRSLTLARAVVQNTTWIRHSKRPRTPGEGGRGTGWLDGEMGGASKDVLVLVLDCVV